MANYIAYARSDYFKVKDEEKFKFIRVLTLRLLKMKLTGISLLSQTNTELQTKSTTRKPMNSKRLISLKSFQNTLPTDTLQ